MREQLRHGQPIVGIAKALTPPILWAAARSLIRHCFPRLPGSSDGRQRGSEYYDEIYERSAAYHTHYTKSHYYFLWAVITDRLVRGGVKSVLDIGCGPGQFAELVRDAGIAEYVGLDFSSEAICRARKRCPQFSFTVDNALSSRLVAERRFEAVVSMEVLEHIEDDIALVERIPTGVRCFFSVPNFGAPAHVRTFDGCNAVRERYGNLFRDLDVQPLKNNDLGGTFFVLEGVRA